MSNSEQRIGKYIDKCEQLMALKISVGQLKWKWK